MGKKCALENPVGCGGLLNFFPCLAKSCSIYKIKNYRKETISNRHCNSVWQEMAGEA